MFFRIFFFFGLFAILGCQTAQQKRIDLLKDRVVKLKPLSTYKPTICRVNVKLTSPAIARYKAMFPAEAKALDHDLVFDWKARESTCEITPVQKSPLTANYKSFLDTSLCLLMQAHWVNSPFDEFPYAPERLTESEGKVRLAAGENKDLGLVLDPLSFVVETHTKGRGVFTATYAEQAGVWLPQRIAQRTPNGTEIVVDEFVWDSIPTQGRLMPRSMWVSVGDQKPLQHSQLEFSECREW